MFRLIDDPVVTWTW